jgi:hypothetical protein
MTQEDSPTETEKVLLASLDLSEGTSTRAKTAETFLELLGARVRNPNTRSAYRVAWRSFLAFCSVRQLELESVKAYHVGAWLDQSLLSQLPCDGRYRIHEFGRHDRARAADCRTYEFVDHPDL